MRSRLIPLCCLVMLITPGIGCVRWTGGVSPQHLGQAGESDRQVPATDARPEIVQASNESLDSAPKIAVHAWMIQFSVTSPNAAAIGKEFDKSLEAAVEEFNSQVTPQSEDFVSSQTLATLVKEFSAKGKVTIFDESPRRIGCAQTDNWGDRISISATPSLDASDGKVVVALSLAYEDKANGSGNRMETSFTPQPGRTFKLGGGSTSGTETKSLIPYLAQIPKFGQSLSIPVTRTRARHTWFMASAAIASDSQTIREQNQFAK